MTRFVFIISLIFYMSACANSPTKIHYYKLSSANTLAIANYSKGKTKGVKRSLVILQSVELAHYLRRQGIVMETSGHQLQIANRHQWAEDLESAVTRLLINELSVQLTGYRFESNRRLSAGDDSYKLKISLEQFHIGRDSQTITSGYFWLFNKNGIILLKQAFSFNRNLKKDGYDHAIGQLETSLHELVKMIAMEIEKR